MHDQARHPIADLTLEAVWHDALARLQAAAADRHHPMRTPVVATADADARMMTLRACAADLATLRFHCDVRSAKLAVLAADPRTGVLAYDPQARVQLRLTGQARVVQQGAEADAAWAQTALSSRRCYLAAAGPGAVLPAPGTALPEALRQRRPSLAESLPGRDNFAVVLVQVATLDWLRLDSQGGVRARLERAPDGPWQGSWVAP